MLVEEHNFEKAIALIRSSEDRIMAIDLETSGLRPYHGDTIAGIAIYAKGMPFYFPFRHGEGDNLPLEMMNPLRALLSLSTIRWVFWNAKFDLQFLLNEGFPYPHHVEDPMLAAHLMNENETNFKLKDLGVKYIGVDAKDEQIELVDELQRRGLGKGSIGALPASLVVQYAEQDVKLTYALRQFYVKHLKTWGIYDLWQEFNVYMRSVVEMERRGMRIDYNRTVKLMDQSRVGMEKATADLSEMAGYIVNPNSPKQVSHLLGIKSTAIEILETLDTPMVKHVISYRRHSKMRGTYYQKFLEHSVEEMSADGSKARYTLHPNLNMIGTETGRFSCSNPNLQALPRGSKDPDDPRNLVKQSFIARPGFVLVQADYKQAEVYLGAHYAQAQGLIDMINSGRDIHTETANQLKIDRYAAKRMNFAMQYGIGAEALAEDLRANGLDVSARDAAGYIKAYNRLHPEMTRMYRALEKEAKQNGIIRMFTGRIKHYGLARGRQPEYHKASSNLIQGGVGELMRIASTNLQRVLFSEGVYQLMHVHDSILFEIPEDKQQWLVPAIKEIMTDFSNFKFTVKFQVDVAVGKRWSDLK